MGMTGKQLVDLLEKPENEGEIKHLEHLKNLHNLEELKHMGGIGGFFSKIALSASKKYLEALMALSECKSTADITAFKQTKHYNKLKNVIIGEGLEIERLSDLKKLQNLKDHLNI